MSKYRSIIPFAVLTVLVIGVIWANSCVSKEASSDQSGFWMQLLQPIFNPNGGIPDDTFHQGVRKAAHFAEFATLGVLVGGLFAILGTQLHKRFWSLPVLIVLLVAVLDEYIQFFAERGSQVTDVMLDFAGGLTGIAIAACMAFFLRKRKK